MSTTTAHIARPTRQVAALTFGGILRSRVDQAAQPALDALVLRCIIVARHDRLGFLLAVRLEPEGRRCAGRAGRSLGVQVATLRHQLQPAHCRRARRARDHRRVRHRHDPFDVRGSADTPSCAASRKALVFGVVDVRRLLRRGRRHRLARRAAAARRTGIHSDFGNTGRLARLPRRRRLPRADRDDVPRARRDHPQQRRRHRGGRSASSSRARDPSDARGGHADAVAAQHLAFLPSQAGSADVRVPDRRSRHRRDTIVLDTVAGRCWCSPRGRSPPSSVGRF